MAIITISKDFLLDPSDEVEILMPRVLDEDFPFEAIQPRLYQLVVWDCSQLERVTSEAVAKWMRFFRERDSRIQYKFKNVPRRLVEVFNNTKNFLPENFRVMSFAWPMGCDICEYEADEMVERGKDYLEAAKVSTEPTLRLPLELNCPNCQGMMEPAVNENSYLRFLKDTNAIKAPKD